MTGEHTTPNELKQTDSVEPERQQVTIAFGQLFRQPDHEENDRPGNLFMITDVDPNGQVIRTKKDDVELIEDVEPDQVIFLAQSIIIEKGERILGFGGTTINPGMVHSFAGETLSLDEIMTAIEAGFRHQSLPFMPERKAELLEQLKKDMAKKPREILLPKVTSDS